MTSSSSSCSVPRDVHMGAVSEEHMKSHITALVRSAPVDDESQWLQWLEDLADQVETASVTMGDPEVVKGWVEEAIKGASEKSRRCYDYEVAMFRPCILYYIHRAIVNGRHCFGTPTENSDVSSSGLSDIDAASEQKLPDPLMSYPFRTINVDDDHSADDASRVCGGMEHLMHLMPGRTEAEEWLPWKETLRDGLNEKGRDASGLAHAPKVRSLISSCGLNEPWSVAWRRILMDDLITPLVALGCRQDLNISILSPLLRYFSTIIPELIEPADVASFADGCGFWKAMVCWTMVRTRCRVPRTCHGRNTVIDRRDQGVFAMIRDYPYSTQALIDLSWCIKYVEACKNRGFRIKETRSLMVQLAAAIQLEFHRRLLIPSAHTSDVLKVYLRTFNAVGVLLNSGRRDTARKVFDWICEPVVSFLQGRSDTVKCVVAAMLEGSENGWDEETLKDDDDYAKAPAARLKRYSTSGEWLGLYNFETPVITGTHDRSMRLLASPVQSAAVLEGTGFIRVWDERFPPISQCSERGSTEAQMLPLLVVGVYGSEDIFIREYRELMCQRLLGMSYISHPQIESTRDARNLVMLKKRFGRDALQPCDVILHDVENSKKISLHIQRKLLGHHRDIPEVSALIVSRHFWPSNAGRARIGDVRHYHQQFEQLRLQPCLVEEMLTRFSMEYELVCGQRELVWLRTEGYADVEITINGNTHEVTCPLIALTVLAVFEDDSEPSWTFTRENILQLIGGGIDEDTVNHAIRFWTSKHVLIENSNGTLSVNE